MRKSRAQILLFLLIVLWSNISAQQDLFYQNGDFIALIVNPAYTGNEKLNDLMVLSRQQWLGFKGSPRSYLLASHFKIGETKAAVGAELIHSSIGPTSETGFYFNYAYKVKLTDKATISMGIKAGADLFVTNFSGFNLIDPEDPLFSINMRKKLLPNFGVGLHLESSNYFIDFSLPSIIRNSLGSRSDNLPDELYKQDRLFVFGAGYEIPVNEEITILPSSSIWITKGAPLLTVLNISVDYLKQIGGSLSFRPGSAFGGGVWYCINKDIKLGYSYELPPPSFRGPQSGTHEIYLGYNFSFLKQKTLSPRRF